MPADALAAFVGLREVAPRRIVGLISGTSADGIDAALVEVRGHRQTTEARLLGFLTRPYDPDLRRRVLALGEARADELLRVHYRLGEEFARAALAGFEERRDAATLNDYEQNMQFARLQPPPGELLGIRAAIWGDQHETNRYCLAVERMIPPEDFFNPGNVGRLMARAGVRPSLAAGSS